MPSFVAGYLSNIFTSDVSWEVICQNIRTIAFHWYEKKKYEVAWAGNRSHIIPEDELTGLLIENFVNGFAQATDTVKDFEEYKNYVLSIAEKTLGPCFFDYVLLLENNHQKAWMVFSKVLKIRSYRWLLEQTMTAAIHHEDVFGEGMKRFYEKLQGKNLNFEDSSKLKSYFFKIMDYIIKEESRKDKHDSIDKYATALFQKKEEEQPAYFDLDDKEYFLLKKGVAKLNETEKKILHGIYYEEKKLKEMARELRLSEENCRIIKYRALKKLKSLL